MKIGCQTYTWEMRGDDWTGRVDDILDAVSAVGYDGIEITNQMIREYADRPAEFARALEARGLALAGFAYAKPSGFTDAGAWTDDLRGAEQALRFLASFPGTVLGLGGASSPDRQNSDAKLAQAAKFYNEIGRRGHREGTPVAFHPHSHHGSLLESRDEYDRIMELTDPDLIGWNPDTGHIVRGGQDLLDTIRRYAHRIRHVHLKDADAANHWQPLGKGICAIPALLDFLKDELGYNGWLVGEEESAEAWSDPAAAIAWNRRYLESLGH